MTSSAPTPIHKRGLPFLAGLFRFKRRHEDGSVPGQVNQ